MARLFISYNNRDRDAAFALRQWLIDQQDWSGHEIFVDAEDLTAGVEWHPKLLAEAESSEVMLFLASEHSLHVDSFCYTELQSAKGQILVVTLGGVTPDDPRFDKALSRHPSAKARQITPLDIAPVEDFPYEALARYPAGSARLNRTCIESLGNTLRELGVAPNSFSWTPKDEGPFPGLRPLMEGDEAIFRGRDLEIRDGIKALDDLRGTVTGRALLIQAPSGAGKSSFLRAGLWRRLRRHPAFTPLATLRTQGGAVRHPEWGLLAGLNDTLKRNEEMGRKLPLAPAELASRAASDLPALLQAFADSDAIEGRRRTLLLGIDQAEEMTALSPQDDEELDHLLRTLFAGRDPSGPANPAGQTDLRLVLTVRDDSIDATMERLVKAGLPREALQVWRLNRLPPNRFDDIIRDVSVAANRAGWPLQIGDALVDGLAAAAAEGSAGESGDALPILALALQRLVQQHRAPATGDVTLPEGQTPKQFLEHAVRDATREARETAEVEEDDLRRLVIPRLATWDPRAGAKGAAKRQVAAAADLFTGKRAGLKRLADALVDQRLLTRTGDAYEVAHEALLRVPPLGDLIAARREKFEQMRILEVETREWVEANRGADHLVRSGGRLQDALTLLDDPDFGPDLRARKQGEAGDEPATVAEYLEACREHEERVARNKRRIQRRVVAGLSTLLVFSVAFSVLAVTGMQRALKARDDSYASAAAGAIVLAEFGEADGNQLLDQIFQRARANGFDGYGRTMPPVSTGPMQRFREWSDLFREGSGGDAFPFFLAKDGIEWKRQTQEIDCLPLILPFWQSPTMGSPVVEMAVSEDGSIMAAHHENGDFQAWRLGTFEAADVPEELVTMLEDEKVIDGGLELLEDSVSLKVSPSTQFRIRQPEAPTACVLGPRAQSLYVGLSNGAVLGWNLESRDRDLWAYVEAGWFQFVAGQKLESTLLPEGGFRSKNLPTPPSIEWIEPPHQVGQIWQNGIGMQFSSIPAGTFFMGSPETEALRDDDEVLHEVRLTFPFWMGAHEVTQRDYMAVMGVNPTLFNRESGLAAPVQDVSYDDALEFCRRLTLRERAAGRLAADWEYALPTEAQWEYAGRAGSPKAYAFGDEVEKLGNFAWFADNSGVKTHPVGEKKPNAWGLYDIHGNVWELCRDWYGDYETGAEAGQPVVDPAGPPAGTNRVYRGGSWFDSAGFCRSAIRLVYRSGIRGDILGFRVAAVPSS